MQQIKAAVLRPACPQNDAKIGHLVVQQFLQKITDKRTHTKKMYGSIAVHWAIGLDEGELSYQRASLLRCQTVSFLANCVILNKCDNTWTETHIHVVCVCVCV